MRENGGSDDGTHLHSIKHFEAMAIASMVHGAIAEAMNAAKRYYSLDQFQLYTGPP